VEWQGCEPRKSRVAAKTLRTRGIWWRYFAREAMDTIESATKTVLAACGEGYTLRTNLAVLKRFMEMRVGERHRSAQKDRAADVGSREVRRLSVGKARARIDFSRLTTPESCQEERQSSHTERARLRDRGGPA